MTEDFYENYIENCLELKMAAPEPTPVRLNLKTVDGEVNALEYPTNVEKLDLRRLNLKTLPYEIQQCRKVKSLIADENCISSIEGWVFQLPNLKVLSVRQQGVRTDEKNSIQIDTANSLEELPRVIARPTQLVSLQELYLTGNKLSSLPTSIQYLKDTLAMLDLMGNNFAEIPQDIFWLKKLKYLGLSGNSIKVIPTEIGSLKKLQILRLSNNKIEQLPEELFQLINLVSLSLRHNKLENLPQGIIRLNKLEQEGTANRSFNLGARNTKYNLKWVNGLHVEGNPLTDPPQDVWKQGTKAIFDYMYIRVPFYPELLEELSGGIGNDWEHFGMTYLQITRNEIELLKREFPHSARDRIHKMLQDWCLGLQRKRKENKQIARELSDAFRRAGKVDLAERVVKVTGITIEPYLIPFYPGLLGELSCKIGFEWKALGMSRLEFTEAEMDHFVMDNPDMKTAILKMLDTWDSKQHRRGIENRRIAEMLSDALRKEGRVDVAEWFDNRVSQIEDERHILLH